MDRMKIQSAVSKCILNVQIEFKQNIDTHRVIITQ